MRVMKMFFGLSVLALLGQAAAPEAGAVKLFDFENAEDVKDWAAFENEMLRAKDAGPKVEISTENATSGKQSLKLTFTAGRLPGVSTQKIAVGDWKAYRGFHADITAPRDCVVLLRAAPKDPRPKGAETEGSFVKLARLSAGKNSVDDITAVGAYGGLAPRLGPVIEFDIALYDARDGDVLYVDNIELSPNPPKATSPFRQKTIFATGVPPKDYAYPFPEKLAVLGREPVKTVVELADQFKDKWVEPKEVTIQETEAAIRAEFEEIKKTHPKAVLAMLRDGEKGFDPKNPEKAFDGWQDAYLGSQVPAGLSYTMLGHGTGKDPTVEFAYRHRCPIYRVDLSSIPAGATILKASFVLTRIVPPDRKQLEGNYKTNSPFKPTFHVAEACNRPWVENETNGYEYAKGKPWKEVNGQNWTGEDPDFLPTIVAHGQPGLTVSKWDFTEAVKFWTDGAHKNYGFCWYPVEGSLDFGRFWTKENREVSKRPLMAVVYEAK